MSLQALIVAVAISMGVVWCFTVLDGAAPAHLQQTRRAGFTRPEHPPIMHLAIVAPPIDRPITSVDIALNHHALKVPGRCNRNAKVSGNATQPPGGLVLANQPSPRKSASELGLPEGFGCLHFGG